MAYYFVSDTHIGGISPNTERDLVAWLESVRGDAQAIFLVGDIFDFWFEYKRLVPKGFVRFFSKVREITDTGIPIHFFPGNHDMWTGDYFERECGMTVHPRGELFELNGKRVFVEHGDGVITDEFWVRVLQKTFRSTVARKIFSALVHPNLALKFGNWWSRNSRLKRKTKHVFRDENEGVVRYARQIIAHTDVDYFVFGHLHCPTEYPLNDNSTLFVLGGWIEGDNTVYGVLSDSGEFTLKELQR